MTYCLLCMLTLFCVALRHFSCSSPLFHHRYLYTLRGLYVIPAMRVGAHLTISLLCPSCFALCDAATSLLSSFLHLSFLLSSFLLSFSLAFLLCSSSHRSIHLRAGFHGHRSHIQRILFRWAISLLLYVCNDTSVIIIDVPIVDQFFLCVWIECLPFVYHILPYSLFSTTPFIISFFYLRICLRLHYPLFSPYRSQPYPSFSCCSCLRMHCRAVFFHQ